MLHADSELVRLAQSGDQLAFEALVVKYQRRIARHVARYVPMASDVEDVVQEVFIRAYPRFAFIPRRQCVLHMVVPNCDKRGSHFPQTRAA